MDGKAMDKPLSLRRHIESRYPYLQGNPDKLLLYITDGKPFCTGTAALSFQSSFTLEVVALDFDSKQATAFLACILEWMQTHQPDMLQNPQRMEKGFRFEVEYINNATCDIVIKLQLTESTLVNRDESGNIVSVAYIPEITIETIQAQFLVAGTWPEN
jgi:hypothetical protein